MNPEIDKVLKNWGICPACHEYKKLTRHHVLRKCWFHGEGRVEWICRECHNLVELVIDAEELWHGGQLEKIQYELIVERFLAGYYSGPAKKFSTPEFLRVFLRANRRRSCIRSRYQRLYLGVY